MVYLTLFTVAFLSTTLLPLGSEALLLYNITQKLFYTTLMDLRYSRKYIRFHIKLLAGFKR